MISAAFSRARHALARPRAARAAIVLVCLGAAAGLGACSMLGLPGSGPPPRLFTLAPKTTFNSDMPEAKGWQLVIEEPTGPASLDTVRIAVHHKPLELEYFAKSAWTDRVPSMMETLLVESFENSGKIVAVGRQSTGLRADYALQPEIRHFEADYPDKLPQAHVVINAKLIRTSQRDIVGNTECDYRSEAKDDTLESVVEAFNEALGRCMKRIVEFTLKTGNEAQPPAK